MTALPPLPEVPPALRALMAEIGPNWAKDAPGHVKRMIESFTPILAAAPKAGIEISRDIAYGSHPRQQLDVFRPAGAARRPVLVFVHGGAFTDGERNRSAEIYSNVLYYFARQGVIGVNIEYRLAPEFRYPSGSEDVGLAVAWTRANIERFGGDPGRIFVMGHSAGGAHTGSYVYDKGLQPATGAGIAGHIVVSGRVRAETWPGNHNAKKVEAYYGSDPAVLERCSCVNHVDASSPPTMIAIAEFENPFLDVHCAELFYRLSAAAGHAPRFLRLAGHNHTSIIAHLNTAEERLGREILDFIETGR
ncbi:MAG: alpha/beta hydrolase [Betaproteobacteria bacterium]|nr:alpha/beta hydrolase [Betaproteobacteria bacterium]